MLTAFVVVLGTLVLQGFTIGPLIRLLRIDSDGSLYEEVSKGRVAMVDAALATLDGRNGDALRGAIRVPAARAVALNPARPQAPTPHDELHLEAIAQQRRVPHRWCRVECFDDDAYHRLEEEFDQAEMNATLR